MTTYPYCVSVVVDPDYGDHLSKLIAMGPIWIVDTPSNRIAAERLWMEHPWSTDLDGVTLFKSMLSTSPEDMVLNQMDTINLHHGIYSADPPYTVVQIVGTPISSKLQDALSEYGFNGFESTDLGFRAHRELSRVQASVE